MSFSVVWTGDNGDPIHPYMELNNGVLHFLEAEQAKGRLDEQTLCAETFNVAAHLG